MNDITAKENGNSIKDEIIDKKSLGKDILIAAVAVLASEAVQLLFSFTFKFRTGMAFKIESSLPADMIVLWIISLGLACIWAYKKTGRLLLQS